eukprot:67196_1
MNGEDPLRIISGSFICLQTQLTNNEFYGKIPSCPRSAISKYTGTITKLADDEYLVFKFTKSGADYKIDKDAFMEKIFEHKIAIVEAKTSDKGLHWRLILPAPVSGKEHNDRLDIEIQWNHGMGRNQLDVTRFDVAKAGLEETPRPKWYLYYEPPVLAIRKGKPMLYFYEHARQATRYNGVTYENKHRWVPYAFDKMHTFRPRGGRRGSVVKNVLFLFKAQSQPMWNKMLTLDDLVYRAARGLIAFDEEGKYLLIGERKENSGKFGKRKEKPGKEKHVRFDLSAKQDMFGDELHDDAYYSEYYSEYYYEDVERLLKLAMANRN